MGRKTTSTRERRHIRPGGSPGTQGQHRGFGLGAMGFGHRCDPAGGGGGCRLAPPAPAPHSALGFAPRASQHFGYPRAQRFWGGGDATAAFSAPPPSTLPIPAHRWD